MITQNIKKLEKANLEGKIYAANTLFAEDGTFKYQGIYKITEFEEMEGYKLTKENYHPNINGATFLNEVTYYTWYEGYVLPLTKDIIETEILHKLFYVKNIKKALENTYEAEDYLNEVVDIALNEF